MAEQIKNLFDRLELHYEKQNDQNIKFEEIVSDLKNQLKYVEDNRRIYGETIYERQSLTEKQRILQQSQVRLLDGQVLLNQRESYLFDRIHDYVQLEMELEASELKLEKEHQTLAEERAKFEIKASSLLLREEAIIKKECELREKEEQLLVSQKKIANNDDIENERRDCELREVDLRHREELILEKERELELQSRAVVDKESDFTEKFNLLEEASVSNDRLLSSVVVMLKEPIEPGERRNQQLKTEKVYTIIAPEMFDESPKKENLQMKTDELGKAQACPADYIVKVLTDEDFDFGDEGEGVDDALGRLLVDSGCISDAIEVPGTFIPPEPPDPTIKLYTEGFGIYKSGGWKTILVDNENFLEEHRNPDTLKKLNDVEEAKKELEQQEYFDPKIANKESELAEKYEVQGFPTTYFFADGVHKHYSGQRTKDGIATWIKKKIGPGIHNILEVMWFNSSHDWGEDYSVVVQKELEVKLLKLSHVSRINSGQRTPIFQRYPWPEKEYQSFSLIYNDRSLNLICKDKDEAEVWFSGLKALVSRGHLVDFGCVFDVIECRSVCTKLCDKFGRHGLVKAAPAVRNLAMQLRLYDEMDEEQAPKKKQELLDGLLLSERDKLKFERRKRKEDCQREIEYQMHLAEMEAGEAGMHVVSVNHDDTIEGPAIRDIRMENFNVSFGGRDLIVDGIVTLSLGRHYELVRRNGTGKKTFLRYMAMHANDGISKNCQILHVEQEVVGDDTFYCQCVLNADVERTQLLEEETILLTLQREVEVNGASNKDSNGEMENNKIAQLNRICKRLEFVDVYSAESRTTSILAGLSFTSSMQKRATRTFSGGWRMQIAFARALFKEPVEKCLRDANVDKTSVHYAVLVGGFIRNVFVFDPGGAVFN